MIPKLLKLSALIVLLIISGCGGGSEQSFQCAEYDWDAVQDLVFPYLDENMQTTMVMQAQSADYKNHMAADFALTFADTYPDSIVVLLKKIEGCNGSKIK